MSRATWNDTTLAEAPADRCVEVEGNIYFPPDAINRAYFQESATHTVCSWKGTASYYDVVVKGAVNHDAAWYYPQPSAAAQGIAGHLAFWHGVRVEK